LRLYKTATYRLEPQGDGTGAVVDGAVLDWATSVDFSFTVPAKPACPYDTAGICLSGVGNYCPDGQILVGDLLGLLSNYGSCSLEHGGECAGMGFPGASTFPISAVWRTVRNVMR
jgi:hypothetical protein